MMKKEHFTTNEVVLLSGLSKTMVDYLVRTGIHLPSISGRCLKGVKRQYSFFDLVILKAIKKLLEQGVSVKKLKDAFNSLTKRDKQEIETGGIWHYIVTDGVNVFLKKENDLLIDLTNGGQLSFLFIIQLQNISSKLRKDVQVLRAA